MGKFREQASWNGGTRSWLTLADESTTRMGGVEMMLAEEERRRLFIYHVVGKPDVAVANEINVDSEL